MTRLLTLLVLIGILFISISAVEAKLLQRDSSRFSYKDIPLKEEKGIKADKREKEFEFSSRHLVTSLLGIGRKKERERETQQRAQKETAGL